MCFKVSDELYVADELAALIGDSRYFDDEAYMICESCLDKFSHAVEAARRKPSEERNEEGDEE